MSFETVIGLEVHIQLNTNSKIWCGDKIDPYAFENSRVCEVCSGAPGTLPALNQDVLKKAIMLGLATDSEITRESTFDRKNYFYPDLPKGYQITQLDRPLATNGFLEVHDVSGAKKKIRIERIQIEEDTGKSSHDETSSLINLNRAGTPLLEIVSCPDISSADEAIEYLKQLHSIVTYLDICNGKLQEGNFRVDVNLSLRPEGQKEYGIRTEVKNINSFKFVEKAIEHEFNRHKKILEAGGTIDQETRTFNVAEQKTVVLRSKADAHDYRYFPEPDLVPLFINDETINNIQSSLPELPLAKKERFISDYELPEYDAKVLTGSKSLADYFEETVKNYSGAPKKAANWIMVELLRFLNEANIDVEKSPVSSKNLSELLNFVHEGSISGKMAKEVFEQMFDTGKSAKELVEAMGGGQLNDDSALEELAKKVVSENPGQVEQYKGGKDRLFGFFVGQVMKLSKGKANPEKTTAILKKLLS